jgi:spermidine/putrescine transport system ATP-binding protein
MQTRSTDPVSVDAAGAEPSVNPDRKARAGGRRSASAISIRGLKKAFGADAVALAGVDLEIAAGEFFTLLGPSGCGKTTLLRILAGLEEPDAGELRVGGEPVMDIPAHRRSVNTVFQSYALFPHLNVADNIGFGLRMRGVPKAERQQRVRETAEFIKIAELLGRRVDQLSGGQRQRVALARALINEPDVLLLDEPLSALDAGLRAELQVELLRTQKRLGMTFVFVTHDQQEAMVMSDRIAVLDDGRIQQTGTPDEIYERPRNLFVARFMGHDNLFPILRRDGDTLETPLGVLHGRFPESGSHVLLRPETLDLGREPTDGSNSFRGRVEERLYRGSVAEYRLSCGGERVTVTCNNRGGVAYDEGEEISFTVTGEDIVTLEQ